MIAVYLHPDGMTKTQYEQIAGKLEASAAPRQGLKHHSCFGEDGHLMVFDVWESQADWDAFVSHLTPILEELGIGGEPAVMPVVDIIQP